MIFYKKIMISCIENHNFNSRYYNISTECHNFFKKKETFLSFKILNKKKVELWILNAYWKVVAMWSNSTRQCALHRIFYAAHSVQRNSLNFFAHLQDLIITRTRSNEPYQISWWITRHIIIVRKFFIHRMRCEKNAPPYLIELRSHHFLMRI